ncbi:MAG: carbonic anhydrase family protein [Spirochaetaceae bacterium]|jgi:carbonic anhydrase|nr:carbonic anhydrase family protein [Spirochaetaceae bacterium]
MTRKYGNRLSRGKGLFVLAALGLLSFAFYACTGAASHKADVHPVSAEAKHWSYTGDTGPEYWYSLDPAFGIAKEGRAQSPIAIDTAALAPLKGEEPGKPVIAYRETPFEIENNGHTIELIPVSDDNYITIGTEVYVLRQFHFHAPSEHRIDGKAFVMELHLVHENAQGDLAVMGSMISEGAENEALKEAFAALPGKGDGTVSPTVTVNPADLFNGEQGAYLYEGSLTTPPCSEGVKWTIAAKPIELSTAQIQAFTALYTGNNRPVQALNRRAVYAAP